MKCVSITSDLGSFNISYQDIIKVSEINHNKLNKGLAHHLPTQQIL